MKGNAMMRLLALMILVPLILAHFTGQVDLTKPTWLWLTLLAGLNALQSTYTGWCPPANFFNKDGKGASCCTTESSCCGEESKDSCCSSAPAEKESACCSGDSKKGVSGTGCCGSDSSDKLVIKVLGSGCANCDATAKLIERAASEHGVGIELVKVEDFAEIAAYGVMSTPAVVIDEKVVHSGSVPTKDVVAKWFE
ncbi:MTH895/ArsE family thioredoxin-like protein [Thiomicrorhabdus sp. ZW0627]|uniref:MTH895/ArsE family thioredoxin-like protein n=1 Tax=Thiomicrorhabdus sp. ZW0627 TaxID=3039774 RepID=UPI0024371D74|nr:MTH895/ArsE family thioredoxin-like protein [Thiomicrorhabdus sp. ZW0627]MDG6772816.1 MTH895/ArsE family thioredoxin-like protein [Thiomicrorhabdus sp. ZW0627]